MKAPNILLVTTLLAATLVGAAPTEDPPTFILQWGSPGTGPGQFHSPFGVATDVSGNVYVVDSGNSRIQRFTGNGAFLTEWGRARSGFPDEPPGNFDIPHGIAVSPSQEVYVTDRSFIQVFTTDGAFVRLWGGFGSEPGYLRDPDGIAIDIARNVYVADTGNNRIQKFTSSGQLLLTWGSAGTAPGKFQNPTGITTDRAGNVYVVDRINHRIQKFAPDSTFLGDWGNAVLQFPYYIATDADGNLYVTDRPSCCEQTAFKFSSTGTLLTQWGSRGTGEGQFLLPTGIAVDTHGHVFVSDESSFQGGRIQKFGQVPTAIAPTTWGTLKVRYR